MEQAFAINCGVALLLGLAIGLERQVSQHPAGLRTNGLVCLGAALFVAISLLQHDNDSARVVGQVVTGIGFLGGGIILRDGMSVKGLTTSATLWCTGAIGALSGCGYPVHATIGTAVILFTNICLAPVGRWLDARVKATGVVETSYRLRAVCDSRDESAVRALMLDSVNAHPSMVVHGIVLGKADEPGKSLIVADIFSTVRDDHAMQEMVARINLEPSVTSVSWDRSHSN